MRCPRCGNDNPDDNRFCGMCGGSLLPASETVVSGAAQASATARTSTLRDPEPSIFPQSSAAERISAAPVNDSPSISGPSFLGLNDPAPTPRRQGSLSIDPHSSSSSNLNYLLDDEEQPRSGVAGKIVLILLVLAMAIGFGYFRWKHGLPPWSLPMGAKPAATADPNSSAAETPAASSPSPTTSPATAQPSPNQPASAQPSAAQPGPTQAAPAQGADNTNSPAANSSAGSAGNSPAPSGATPAPTSNPSQPDATTSTAGSPASEDAANPSAAAPSTAKSAAVPTPETPHPAKRVKPGAAASKPAAGVKPATSGADAVAEAQKYLYGRGVPQDCERGMHLLKPAASQSNPKALIEMGALYSAGLCTPHDLPTAYRWFAMALRKEPENQSVQADLQKLWGEMTQPERQLAIKLSQ